MPPGPPPAPQSPIANRQSTSPPSIRCSPFAIRHSAFTLVELLVVIAIITILIASVIVAGTSLINRSKSSATQAMLILVRDAVDQFEREQKAHPTLARFRPYRDRFGHFPPDELELFAVGGRAFLGIGPTGGPSFAPGGAAVVPGPSGGGYDQMKFYRIGLSPEDQATEHRDLTAMILAITQFGKESKTTLERIQDRYWIDGPVDADGEPALFLDRNGDGTWQAEEDLAVRWIVDDWGVPISYFAQRDYDPSNPDATRSSNHEDWNDASTELIQVNGGRPLIVSYGPNGKDQFTSDAMGDEGNVSLVGDFEALTGDVEHIIDQPENADNIYPEADLRDALAREK